MIVSIDDREKTNRISNAVDYFEKLDYTVNVNENLYGDYVFKNNDITVAFEYKTIEDFIDSITDYRVFNQALNQSNHFDYHFVIVVGTDKDKTQAIQDKQRYTGGYITNKQFYGAYASLVNITSLIQVPTEKLAFMVMGQIADKCCNDKPVLKRFPKSRGTPALRLLTNNVNGVGYVMAERICDELGLTTVYDVLSLKHSDLVCVNGVGNITADKILKQLRGEFDL